MPNPTRVSLSELVSTMTGDRAAADTVCDVKLPYPREDDTGIPQQRTRPAANEDPFFGVQSAVKSEFTEQVRRVAPQDVTLLFTGETGTGKTRMARLVHMLSPRRAEPFMVVDCGSLSPTLIESEMFGHIRGAFTGADRDRQGKLAAAGGGTLLLDEINSLPLPLQSKLLRVVDERVFEPVGSNKPQVLRARLIAVSNAPLDREVEAGRFRSDLFYRLNVVGFYLPPLRDRRPAIAALAAQFLADFAATNRPDCAAYPLQRCARSRDTPGRAMSASCETSSSGPSPCAQARRSSSATCRRRHAKRPEHPGCRAVTPLP